MESEPSKGVREMPAAAQPPKPVESVTRVNVAFPFAKIQVGGSDLERGVRELARLVADLAMEIETQHKSAETTDLTARARALAEALEDR
jgi:hypothetical protein